MPFKLTFNADPTGAYARAEEKAKRELAAKIAAGRKEYGPARCRDVVAYMAQGHTLTAYAGYLGVSRGRVDDWIKTYPEFAEAAECGRAAAVQFWEKEQKTAQTEGRSSAAAAFALKNLSPLDWREKIEVKSDVRVSTTQEELADAIDRKFSKLIEHDPTLDVQSVTPRKTRH